MVVQGTHSYRFLGRPASMFRQYKQKVSVSLSSFPFRSLVYMPYSEIIAMLSMYMCLLSAWLAWLCPGTPQSQARGSSWVNIGSRPCFVLAISSKFPSYYRTHFSLPETSNSNLDPNPGLSPSPGAQPHPQVEQCWGLSHGQPWSCFHSLQSPPPARPSARPLSPTLWEAWLSFAVRHLSRQTWSTAPATSIHPCCMREAAGPYWGDLSKVLVEMDPPSQLADLPLLNTKSTSVKSKMLCLPISLLHLSSSHGRLPTRTSFLHTLRSLED